MDQEKVKSQIRKLLNLAADDAATEGEIKAAMHAADRLLEKHHLERADIEAEAGLAAPPEARDKMASVRAVGGSAKLRGWEQSLASAVAQLVGSVGYYYSSPTVMPTGTFGKLEKRQPFVFYGPEEDAELAKTLFEEWQHVIATLAVGKYGGCYNGDGGMYAVGFVEGLHSLVFDVVVQRKALSTPSTRALVRVGQGSLAEVLEQKRDLAKQWLKEERGVTLRRGASGAGVGRGSLSARDAGRSDGRRADFTAKRRPKLPG